MLCLPWSPDLTICDNSLWGTVKENISQLHLTTAENLKAAIRDCFNDPTVNIEDIQKNMGKTKISDKNGRENTDNFYFLLLFLVG
jgi:hypothetical protein